MPGTGLGRRLEGLLLSAERVVAGSALVGGTVGLTTWLDPDESIDEGVSSGASRADTETGTLDVAPVTPLLAETLLAVAASIDDSLAGHTGALELGGEETDVLLLVLGLVPLSIGGLGELSWGEVVGVPSSNVGGNTTNLLGGTSLLVGVGKFLGTRL